jgi:hypothetical protein
MSAYVNIHGQPIGVSARDAVVAIHREAWAAHTRLSSEMWVVYRTPRSDPIGTGASEESAWRDAWSRMLADDVAKEGAK